MSDGFVPRVDHERRRGQVLTVASIVLCTASVVVVVVCVAGMFDAHWFPESPTPAQLDSAVRQYHRAAVGGFTLVVVLLIAALVARRWFALGLQIVLLVLLLASFATFRVTRDMPTDPARPQPTQPYVSHQPCFSGSGNCN